MKKPKKLASTTTCQPKIWHWSAQISPVLKGIIYPTVKDLLGHRTKRTIISLTILATHSKKKLCTQQMRIPGCRSQDLHPQLLGRKVFHIVFLFLLQKSLRQFWRETALLRSWNSTRRCCPTALQRRNMKLWHSVGPPLALWCLQEYAPTRN